MAYGAGHIAPIQHDSNCLDYICKALFVLGKGQIEEPPDSLTEKWILDFVNLEKQPESIDSGIDIPDSIFDSGDDIILG